MRNWLVDLQKPIFRNCSLHLIFYPSGLETLSSIPLSMTGMTPTIHLPFQRTGEATSSNHLSMPQRVKTRCYSTPLMVWLSWNSLIILILYVRVREPHRVRLRSASIDDLCVPFLGRTLQSETGSTDALSLCTFHNSQYHNATTFLFRDMEMTHSMFSHFI